MGRLVDIWDWTRQQFMGWIVAVLIVCLPVFAAAVLSWMGVFPRSARGGSR